MDEEDSILDGLFGGAIIGGLLGVNPIVGGLFGGLLDSLDE